MNCPTLVILVSLLRVIPGPCCEAFTTMLRNFIKLNNCPFLPTLFEQKKIGPGESIFIAKAITAKRGDRMIKTNNENKKSKIRVN